MDIFEIIENMKKYSEDLDKTIHIPDTCQPIKLNPDFDFSDSPLHKILKEQTEELKRAADAAEKRAEIAEKEVARAAGKLQKEQRKSRISNGIVIAAVAVAIMAWLIPRELMLDTIQNFFHNLYQIFDGFYN